MAQKGLPAIFRQMQHLFLIIPSLLTIAAPASDRHIPRNVQPHSETVHPIEVFNSCPVRFEIALTV